MVGIARDQMVQGAKYPAKECPAICQQFVRRQFGGREIEHAVHVGVIGG
jgi:hypothetical protein